MEFFWSIYSGNFDSRSACGIRPMWDERDDECVEIFFGEFSVCFVCRGLPLATPCSHISSSPSSVNKTINYLLLTAEIGSRTGRRSRKSFQRERKTFPLLAKFRLFPMKNFILSSAYFSWKIFRMMPR